MAQVKRRKIDTATVGYNCYNGYNEIATVDYTISHTINPYFKVDFVWLNLSYYKDEILSSKINSSAVIKFKSEVLFRDSKFIESFELGNSNALPYIVITNPTNLKYYYMLSEKDRAKLSFLVLGAEAAVENIKFYTDGLIPILNTINKANDNTKRMSATILYKLMSNYDNYKGLAILSKYISNRNINWIGLVDRYCILDHKLDFYNRHKLDNYNVCLEIISSKQLQLIKKIITVNLPICLAETIEETFGRYVKKELFNYYLSRGMMKYFNLDYVNHANVRLVLPMFDSITKAKILLWLREDYYCYFPLIADRYNIVYIKKHVNLEQFKNIEIVPTECIVCYELTMDYTSCYHRLCSKCDEKLLTNKCPMCRQTLSN